MSVTLRSPRGIVHLSSSHSSDAAPAARPIGADSHAGTAERIRLLEESISDEAEKHRRIEMLGALAVRANAAAASPSPAPAHPAPRGVHSPAPSIGSSQKLGARPPRLRVRYLLPRACALVCGELAANVCACQQSRCRLFPPARRRTGERPRGLRRCHSARSHLQRLGVLPDACHPPSSCSPGFPADGQTENKLSMAVRDADFCRLSLTPRDSIRVGNVQARQRETRGRRCWGGRAGGSARTAREHAHRAL